MYGAAASKSAPSPLTNSTRKPISRRSVTDRREIGFRVEVVSGDGADFDAAAPYIPALMDAVDPREIGADLVAARGRAEPAGLIGEGQEQRGDDQNDRADHDFDDIAPH